MRFFAQAALVGLAFSQSVNGLHILLGNDDGWASANIREFYRLLKAAGHKVIMVAPVVDNSGQGGRSVFTNSATLTTNGEFDSVLAGAPSLGQDPHDPNVWYYNGTPAACTFIGLDFVIPQLWPGVTPDLFVSGPNVGTNLGSFLYTLSGTMGSTYAAVGRGIPGIAFSASTDGGQRYYKWVNKTTAAHLPDPATINAELSVKLVNELAKNTRRGERLLPLGYGLNVNYPPITSFDNKSCIDPPFIQTRLTGSAFTDKAVYNATTKLFTYGNIVGSGVNRCINGDCKLPGETEVVSSGCKSSVSVFSIDYDAPLGHDASSTQQRLLPLVQFERGHYRRDGVSADILERSAPLRHE